MLSKLSIFCVIWVGVVGLWRCMGKVGLALMDCKYLFIYLYFCFVSLFFVI